MAKTVPTTKAGKQATIEQVMREYTHDDLHSSSGEKVQSKQALAIALESSGQSRKKGKKNA